MYWRRATGLSQLHAGRIDRWPRGSSFTMAGTPSTSLANEGLRRFKLGFGSREERIEYSKYDFVRQTFVRQIDHSATNFRPLFRCMPLPVLRLAGEMLYPHLS